MNPSNILSSVIVDINKDKIARAIISYKCKMVLAKQTSNENNPIDDIISLNNDLITSVLPERLTYFRFGKYVNQIIKSNTLSKKSPTLTLYGFLFNQKGCQLI